MTFGDTVALGLIAATLVGALIAMGYMYIALLGLR